ncbi:uncharacterized protein LOC111486935 [Cucurbita maxima]|uniref:Uncharacterized protein LOC111486935 n=1 Tax=Cucurbita maxima TaxID=3661 RepID=A0A6J1JH06_CUCMA|nr:uncharacterized protein LOC111486935 [Cucurbita maxima]XP_022989873.1 uncharacterized protein LOC111486935 [Cucurbita maxima]
MDPGEAARRMLVGSNCGKAIINPITMRFRPIAPKPVAGASVSGDTSSILKGRRKRKYVRVQGYNRKKKTTRSNTTTTEAAATTLQLLPERHVEIFGSGSPEVGLVSDGKRGAAAEEVWVTVECARGACIEGDEEERMKKLEEDTCPGFVSDGVDRVEWVNEALKRMVRQRQRSSEAGEEIEIRLRTRPRLGYLGRAFTCQMKLHFKAGTTDMVVPCDAWRIAGGGTAWKLDLNAALSLAPPLQQD